MVETPVLDFVPRPPQGWRQWLLVAVVTAAHACVLAHERSCPISLLKAEAVHEQGFQAFRVFPRVASRVPFAIVPGGRRHYLP